MSESTATDKPNDRFRLGTPAEPMAGLGRFPAGSDSRGALYRQMMLFARDLRVSLGVMETQKRRLLEAQRDSVARLLRVVRLHDLETLTHLERIAAYVRVLATRLGVEPDEIDDLATAATLHDLGKIGIDAGLLNKPGPLAADEMEQVRGHTTLGGFLLEGSSSPLMQLARDIALTHHENWDGSGYPGRRAGTDIPLGGRLVRLADTYDALRSQRPYKPRLDHLTSVRIILEGDRRTDPVHFDPELLSLFEICHGDFGQVWEEARRLEGRDPNGGWDRLPSGDVSGTGS